MLFFKYNEKENKFEYDGSPEGEVKMKAQIEKQRANPSPGQKNMMEMFDKIENIKKSFQNIPLVEYIDILKYKQIVTLENLDPSHNKIKLLLDFNTIERKHLFETVEVKKKKDTYTLSMGFSDYIKCSLLTNIQKNLRLTKEEVYHIGSLLSYDIKQYSITKDGTPITQEFIKPYLDEYPSLDIMLSENLFDLSYIKSDDFFLQEEYDQHGDPQKAYSKFLEQFSTHTEYIPNNKFEKAIYHIIAYDKTILIPFHLRTINTVQANEKLSYYSEETISYDAINETYIASVNAFIELSTLDFGKTDDNFHLLHGFFGLKKISAKKRGLYIHKSKYLKENALITIKSEYDKIYKDSFQKKKVEGLHILIEKIETELELGNYSLEEYKDIIEIKNDTTEIKESSEGHLPLLGNIEEFMKHLGSITEGTLQTEIKNKRIEKIEVFKKDRIKSQKELREEYPFAEVGGQQHNGKHTYSTVRYKKELKKRK